MSPTASSEFLANPSCQFNQHLCRKWDQRFESAFLQRRVSSEPRKRSFKWAWRPGPRVCGAIRANRGTGLIFRTA
jgi:hypothetical protein